ncbi:hypothetical protein [Bradyrhizobium sp.]|nr:hypothetical protein [Bradyrhizobium sp.]
MKQPDEDKGEEPARAETPRQAEGRHIIQQYIDDLRELIRKLRGKLH